MYNWSASNEQLVSIYNVEFLPILNRKKMLGNILYWDNPQTIQNVYKNPKDLLASVSSFHYPKEGTKKFWCLRFCQIKA